MQVSGILQYKGGHIYSIKGDSSVYDALKIMADENIGALMVMEGERLTGIFSERDYARKIVLKGASSRETQVKEIMTENVITVSGEDTIEKCMELMSTKHIRHLPVVDKEKVVGLISIGDVVNAIIANQKETIAHLQQYISQ